MHGGACTRWWEQGVARTHACMHARTDARANACLVCRPARSRGTGGGWRSCALGGERWSGRAGPRGHVVASRAAPARSCGPLPGCRWLLRHTPRGAAPPSSFLPPFLPPLPPPFFAASASAATRAARPRWSGALLCATPARSRRPPASRPERCGRRGCGRQARCPGPRRGTNSVPEQTDPSPSSLMPGCYQAAVHDMPASCTTQGREQPPRARACGEVLVHPSL